MTPTEKVIKVQIKRQPITNSPIWCKMNGDPIAVCEIQCADLIYSTIDAGHFQIIKSRDSDFLLGNIFPINSLAEFTT